MAELKRLVRCLLRFPQAERVYSTPRKVCRSTLGVYGDSDWAGGEERKRSTAGVATTFGGHPIDTASATQWLGRAVQRGGGALRLQLQDRTANVPLPDRGGLRGDSASVERQQCLPRDRLQARHRQAQTLGRDGCREESFLVKSVRTDENVVNLMTKHLAAARIGELLSKLGVRRWCARRLVVASLIMGVDANHFDRAHRTRGDGEPHTRGHVAGRGVRGSGALVVLAGVGGILQLA